MLMEARLLDERREGIAEGKDIGFAEGKDIGFAEGKDIGFAEGKDIGFAEGKDVGLVEGEAKEKLATAKRLFSMGLSVKDIAKATSLPIEQAEQA